MTRREGRASRAVFASSADGDKGQAQSGLALPHLALAVARQHVGAVAPVGRA